MALTDSQLMMLEQLTYLTDDIYKNAGTSKVDNPRTVRELMSAFMDEAGQFGSFSVRWAQGQCW